MTAPEPREEYRRRQRANFIAMAAVAVLILGSIVLLAVLHHGIKQESCFAANHRTCDPIDEQQ